MLHNLAVAFCLMLVIEGILPFLAPGRWRKMLEAVEQVDDNTVRLLGFGSMIVGTVLLYIVN
ncbi:MAG: DUF2065 domain-containing protein [Gammaproteobacteria bacterium]|nr:DUF2065 domain-containing protein [Gammaproteobacteria bacterium]